MGEVRTKPNIHEPTDSSLLWDSTRVLTRILNKMKEGLVADILFTDHTRRAKRRSLQILNAKSKKARVKPYKDLLKITGKTVSYSKSAAAVLESYGFTDTRDMALAVATLKDFEELIPLAEKVIDQTTRRILHDEKVPAQEKIFSIFEPHTDIIIKDRRNEYYGHKVCLTGGSSNFISDCLIVDGNPADSTLTCQMLDRHDENLWAISPECRLGWRFRIQS